VQRCRVALERSLVRLCSFVHHGSPRRLAHLSLGESSHATNGADDAAGRSPKRRPVAAALVITPDRTANAARVVEHQVHFEIGPVGPDRRVHSVKEEARPGTAVPPVGRSDHLLTHRAMHRAMHREAGAGHYPKRHR
jgi:hypothetical protein